MVAALEIARHILNMMNYADGLPFERRARRFRR